MDEKKQVQESTGIMDKMRKQTHIVLWILVFAFLGTIIFDWGMDLLGAKSPTSVGVVGTVNGTDISYQEFFQQMQNHYALYQQQLGTAPDAQYMRNYREQLWNEIVNNHLVGEVVEEQGITASNAEIVYEIRYHPDPAIYNAPEFQLPEGGFDQAKYESFLASDQTGTVVILENQARAMIPFRKLQQMVVASIRVTEDEIKQKFLENETSITADFIQVLPARFVDDEIEISESEISNYFRENKDNFFVSETRQLNYVLFDAVTSSEDSQAINRNYDDILARAKAGEDFAALSQQVQENDGYFGTVAEGGVTKEYNDVLFQRSNKTGDILGPVETSFGKSIFKIEHVVKTRGKIDSVEAKHILFKYEPSDNTLDIAENAASFFSQIAGDEGFAATAESEGHNVNVTGDINRTGFIPGFGNNEEIFSFAFYSEMDGDNTPTSHAIQIPSGFAVFSLSKINEAHTRNLDEVRDQIRSVIRNEKQLDLAFGLIESVKSQIDKGMSYEDAAAEININIRTTSEFKIRAFIPELGNDSKFSTACFGINVGEFTHAIKGAGAAYLAKILTKTEFNEELYAQRHDELSNTLMNQKRQQAYNDWLVALREKADIEDFRDQFFK